MVDPSAPNWEGAAVWQVPSGVWLFRTWPMRRSRVWRKAVETSGIRGTTIARVTEMRREVRFSNRGRDNCGGWSLNALKRFEPQIYSIVRIVLGFMFSLHGGQKLLGWFGGAPPQMPAGLLYTGGSIELIGGALILVGFRTSYAAFLCSGMMAAAYFMAHQSKGLLPIQNHGELAVLYCFIFLLIAAKGSGIWSVDDAMNRS
jgi:putative oxidoreductase